MDLGWRQPDVLVDFGDRRQIQDRPLVGEGKDEAREVIKVDALHDDDDRTGPLVVEPRHERGPEPFVGRAAPGLRQRIFRLQRVVDHQKLGAAARECSANRGREAEATGGEHDFDLGVLPADASPGKQVLVPRRLHQRAEIVGVLLCEVARIGHADNPLGGIVAKQERGEGDRRHDRFQRPWRQVDDQTFNLAAPNALKLPGDRLQMPSRHELLTRRQRAKRFLNKSV